MVSANNVHILTSDIHDLENYHGNTSMFLISISEGSNQGRLQMYLLQLEVVWLASFTKYRYCNYNRELWLTLFTSLTLVMMFQRTQVQVWSEKRKLAQLIKLTNYSSLPHYPMSLGLYLYTKHVLIGTGLFPWFYAYNYHV